MSPSQINKPSQIRLPEGRRRPPEGPAACYLGSVTPQHYYTNKRYLPTADTVFASIPHLTHHLLPPQIKVSATYQTCAVVYHSYPQSPHISSTKPRALDRAFFCSSSALLVAGRANTTKQAGPGLATVLRSDTNPVFGLPVLVPCNEVLFHNETQSIYVDRWLPQKQTGKRVACESERSTPDRPRRNQPSTPNRHNPKRSRSRSPHYKTNNSQPPKTSIFTAVLYMCVVWPTSKKKLYRKKTPDLRVYLPIVSKHHSSDASSSSSSSSPL